MWYIVSIVILIGYIGIMHLFFKKKIALCKYKFKPEDAQYLHLEKLASLGILSAGVAHEINNPLTFLATNLKLVQSYLNEGLKLQDERSKEEAKAMVEECLEGCERIKKIVQDLLFFSSPAVGKTAPIDINHLLDMTLRVLWSEIKYKIDIIKDYKATAQLWIDPNQMSHVFLNIVINATRAIKKSGTIKLLTYEDSAGVFIKIIDTGVGIARENLSKIFEPFFTTSGGTGLGVYVSKKIISDYGGSINVESEVGKGSAFTIFLPKKNN